MPNVTIVAALVAGMLSFLSPCVLPLVPPYLVYLTGSSLERLADEEPEPRRRSVPWPTLRPGTSVMRLRMGSRHSGARR